MALTIEVELDAHGVVHSLEPGKPLPTGRALLVLPDADDNSAWELSKKAFAEDWLTPEEDAAWAYLQPVK